MESFGCTANLSSEPLVPYRFESDATNRILLCRFEGLVTDQTLRDFYRESPEHVARIGARFGVADFSAVTSFEVSPQAIREIASSPSTVPSSLPRVVIAPSPSVFGMARIFQLQGEQTRPDVRVVRTFEEALSIMGVQNPRFEPIDID